MKLRPRALVADLVVIGATIAWSGALWQQHTHGAFDWPTGPALVVHATMTMAAVALVLWRRRRPLGVALVLLPLVATVFVAVPAFVALFAVAAAHRRTTAILVGVGYLAAAATGSAVLEPAADGLPALGLFDIAFFALPIALGQAHQARQALMHELADRATRAEAEQQLRIEQAHQRERQRIAREMHDVVAHRISLISMHAGALTYRPDQPPDDVRDAADVIRASAHDALEELRAVVGALREADETEVPEPPQPTLADIPALLDRCRTAGARLNVRDHAPASQVPPSVGRTAYRILQEGLTNAAKHAPHSPVDIVLDARRPGHLRIEVTNALPLALRSEHAPDPLVRGGGAGLVGMGERVDLLGGHLQHGPTGDGRFRLRADLPWTR